MDTEDMELVNESDGPEYDRHKFAKMMLIAVASFVVGKGIEHGYEAIREARSNRETTDTE